jgi:hypothetical protein
MLDLISYAAEKAGNPDEDPKWPKKKWMIGDILLAFILQIIFWNAVVELAYGYSYGTNILGAYGTLAVLLCWLVSHVRCIAFRSSHR